MQAKPYRVTSIDILRGLVMIIMALDHTRDFFHKDAMIHDPMDLATTTAPIFFTRWITHFCAPTFVFLSGVSAYLSSQKKNKAEASLFMIKRGLWLLVIEVVVITFGLSFNPFYSMIFLQVIWAIGCSMILMGILSRISYSAVLVVGAILFFGHNLIDIIPHGNSPIWNFILTSPNFIPFAGNHVLGVLYSVLPWTGIMLMGYCMGRLYRQDFAPAKRKQILIISGSALIVIFLILRWFNMYGNPQPWAPQQDFAHSLFSFLNTSKYPPSLHYAGMTLGPAILMLAFTENIKNWFSDILSVYGKVPFFYYVLHFYVLHTVLVIAFFAAGYSTDAIQSKNMPFFFRPTEFGYSLAGTYLVWLAAVALLYKPCVWFGKYKATHKQWWLSYL
ncbi:MAG: hypothetical protein K0S09_140 [Sphingobacteriaceae bacterium]|jgi:uncharacterized membrane protein|nr:hypothetical protein [Sphingobacteriaceae bacterium]